MTRRPVKNDFSGFICRPYCVFFKEGQKEEMACGAAVVAATLIRNGTLSIGSFPDLEELPAPPQDDLLLFDLVCRSCPFVLDGCDFRLPTPPIDAVACGGLVLIYALYRTGEVTPDILRKMAHE